MTSISKKENNLLIVYGKPVDKEGLGGADFASNSMNVNLIEEKIPRGDPFIERKIIKATIEAINNNLIQSCRDIGAAGLAGATAEIAEKGKLGVCLDLTNVKKNNNDMNICEIMLSESQERMLVEIREEDINDFMSIMLKYNISASNIGHLIKDDKYIINFNGKQVAMLPLSFLVKGVPKQRLLSEKDMLSSSNVYSKKWLEYQFKNVNNNYTYYNSLTNKKDPSILKITNNEGIIISCGCNPYISNIDPYYGIQYSIVENIMNLAIKGSNYLCLVNNLNFGDPNEPHQYWFLEQSIYGMRDLCKKLNLPVVGGNVSLYNESKEFNQTILPTVSIGIISKINLLNKIPSSIFQSINETIYIIGETDIDFYSNKFYKKNTNINNNKKINKKIPDNINNIITCVINLINSNLITSSYYVSRYGIISSIANMIENIGVSLDLSYLNTTNNEYILNYLFSESPCRVIISTSNPKEVEKKMYGLKYQKIGYTNNKEGINISINNKEIVSITIKELLSSLFSLNKIINT